MAIEKQKQAHLWERDASDWYVEPAVVSLALFRELPFSSKIWDPACGMGRIAKSAQYCGKHVKMSDIVNRTSDPIEVKDFREFDYRKFDYDIVTNPPFAIAEQFVQHAISMLDVGQKAAFLLPLVWMSGFSTKRDWMPNSPLRYIAPISPRPSMPPGKVILSGTKPGNGTKDFGWFVWEIGFSGQPEIVFLNTNPHKEESKNLDALMGDKLCGHLIAA